MCGIAGVFSLKGAVTPQSAECVRRMMLALRHRGPNDSGFYKDDRAILGHTRLSIIDLSPAGHQPMQNDSGTAWLVYNGEIYNFKELRRELEQRGCRFHSDTDSEVIIQRYSQWGIAKLLPRLRGMFAFAIYDASPADGS